MKRWISIGDYILNPDYFNLFYIEHIPSGQWVIFGEDKNQVCWTLAAFTQENEAEDYLQIIYLQIND